MKENRIFFTKGQRTLLLQILRQYLLTLKVRKYGQYKNKRDLPRIRAIINKLILK